MPLEPQNAGRGDPGEAPPGGEAWGWALVQRDWSLRQGEPVRVPGGVRARLAGLGRGVVGGFARALRALLRLISRPAGGGPGTPRSSARPSSSRGC